MHTISMLRRTLGLSSDNQVRNRMERIKDLLSEHIRRGPNNQIFLVDSGLDLMKQFQELCDTGLTLAEASNVLRASSYKLATSSHLVSSSSVLNDSKPDQSKRDLVTELRQEMRQMSTHLSAIENHLQSQSGERAPAANAAPWWTHLMEDVDAT